MTLATTTSRQDYTGDASTQTFSTSSFVFFDSSTLVVEVVTNTTTGASVTLVENTDYTVSGGAGSTGAVDMSGGSSPYGAPASGHTVIIRRVEPLTQPDDLQNNSISDAEVLEDRLDRLTMQVQQLSEELDRSIKLDTTEIATSALTDIPTERASLYLGFDASKGIIATPGNGSTYAATAYILTLLDDVDAPTARTTLGLGATDDVLFKGVVVSGELTWSGVLSPAQITADQNDYAPTSIDASTELRIDSDAARSITGIDAGASQVDGRKLVITNDGSFPITLNHANASSTAANRFDLANDTDVEIAAGGTILLTYDGTASRWRVLGGAGGGGGATGGPGDQIFYLNGQTVSATYTIAATKNAMSAGPITIASGVTVSITSGARWVIV